MYGSLIVAFRQTVVAQSFNAQPEAPAERVDAGASGWALNDAPEVTYACDHRPKVALSDDAVSRHREDFPILRAKSRQLCRLLS